MNRCETMRNELKAYLDGQLPFLVRQQMRRHLKRCVACREELSAMEQTGNQLQADAPTPLEASLRAKILAAAGNVGPKPGERSKAPSKWRRKPLMAWAVAATALTAWCVTYPLTHFPLTHFSQPQMSTASTSMASPPLARSDTAGGPQPGGAVADSPVASAAPMNAPKSTKDSGGMAGLAGVSAVPSAPTTLPSNIGQELKAGLISKEEAAAASMDQGGMRMRDMMKMHSAPKIAATPGIRPLVLGKSAASLYMMDRSNYSRAAGGHKLQMSVPSVRASGGNMDGLIPLHERAGRLASDPGHARRRWTSPSSNGAAAAGAAVQDADETERTVHKEAQITVQVDNVEAKSEAVEQLVQGVGGYVADNNLNTGDDGLKTTALTLKVPVAQFQSVLNQVARQGEVKAKSLSGQDLTEEISDQKQSEHTLREDIQSTQQQLTQRLSRMGREERMDTLRELRTQVAQKQARLKLLHKLGALSTIGVELDEKPRPVPVPVKPHTSGFMNEMNDTLHGAVQSMMQAARLPILTFIWILAYAPLWILLILGYRWAVRR